MYHSSSSSTVHCRCAWPDVVRVFTLKNECATSVVLFMGASCFCFCSLWFSWFSCGLERRAILTGDVNQVAEPTHHYRNDPALISIPFFPKTKCGCISEGFMTSHICIYGDEFFDHVLCMCLFLFTFSARTWARRITFPCSASLLCKEAMSAVITWMRCSDASSSRSDTSC